MSAGQDPPPALLSLGSINADFQARVERPVDEAETLRATRFSRLGGGKGANVAVLARRLGVPAWLLGGVGSDELAAQALAPLRAAGVDLGAVVQLPGATGVAMILVPPGGSKHIVLAQEANLHIDAAARARIVERIDAAPAGSVLVADFELCPRTARAALARARQHGLRTVLDPSFPDAVEAADLALADALTPNEEEAIALAGVQAPGPHAAADAARALAARGPKVVCVKLADGGCLLLEGSALSHLEARRVDTVDSTGAGDAFTGAFAVALLKGLGMREAAQWGVAASTLAVGGWGSQPSYPDGAALAAELARLPGRGRA
jgi:ribokinase